MAIRPFAMAPALAAEFAVVAVAKERVVIRVRFDLDVSAIAAVAAGWPAARDVLLSAEREAAIAAVAALHRNFGFVNEHRVLVPKLYTKAASGAPVRRRL